MKVRIATSAIKALIWIILYISHPARGTGPDEHWPAPVAKLKRDLHKHIITRAGGVFENVVSLRAGGVCNPTMSLHGSTEWSV